MGQLMAGNFRVYWKNAQIFQDLPTSGAGSASGDAVLCNGGLVGINLWGTGKGQGIPANTDYAMVALDGTPVLTVNVGTAITEGSPIYITSANALTTVSTSNTLFGYADEPSGTGATKRIGVRIKAQVNA
jgi:hypothetical protein